MALSLIDIREIDSVIERLCRRIWNLPTPFPRAWIHAMLEKLGLKFPTV
jgi:hypothetical protein